MFASASLIALPRCAFTSLMNAWSWLSWAFTLPRARAAAAASSFTQSEFAMPALLTKARTSVHTLAASSLRVTSCGHVRFPELSAHVKWTVTGAFHQWFPFGGVVGAPLIVGGVSSMTVIVCVAPALFPLLLVAVHMRTMTSGLAGLPAPPLFDSLNFTVTSGQLSHAVASEALPEGTSLTSW